MVAMQWPVGTDDPDSFTSSTIPYPAVAGGHYGDPRDGGARTHMGYDFTPIEGWGVRAVADGRVFFAPAYSDNGYPTVPPGWAAGGVQVWIQHDGFISRYFHLNNRSEYVYGDYVGGTFQITDPIYNGGAGAVVKRGDLVGWVGTTGALGTNGWQYGVYAPHLHLEIVPGTGVMSNTGIDPIPFIRERLAGNTPTPIEQFGDDMYLVRDKALGHIYLIGNQFIKHVKGENAVANLRQAGVHYLEGTNGWTVKNIGWSMGVPMSSVYRESDGMIRDALDHSFGSGHVWSAERRLARILGKGDNF